MSSPISIQSAEGTIASLPGIGVVLAAGTAVPANGRVGFAIGCLFIHVDGAAGSCLYINEGTATSADFDALNAVPI